MPNEDAVENAKESLTKAITLWKKRWRNLIL
jgi:hypothetical protein